MWIFIGITAALLYILAGAAVAFWELCALGREHDGYDAWRYEDADVFRSVIVGAFWPIAGPFSFAVHLAKRKK